MSDACDGAQPPSEVRDRVDAALASFFVEQRVRWASVPDPVGAALASLGEFVLCGGKWIRPAFCYWGWRGAGGADCAAIVAVAASVELLHACALIHDDVMDASALRRGRPSVHRAFAGQHADAEWRGEAAEFGRSAAVLMGDLCLLWSDELYHSAPLAAHAFARARGRYDQMRVEPVLGQFLDLVDQADGLHSLARAREVARLKSARYTVERPLQLGAALAGATDDLLDAFSRFGLPLGEAFQLRDDILGVFGDAAVTGKPVGDDLREGKCTPLIMFSRLAASAAQREALDRFLGDPELGPAGIDALRSVIVGSGALARAEALIDELTDRSLRELAAVPVDTESRAALAELVADATRVPS